MKRLVSLCAASLLLASASAETASTVPYQQETTTVVQAVVPNDSVRRYHAHYYKRVEEFEKQRPIGRRNTVMLGNSLTENGGDWGKKLHRRRVVNRGIIGDEAMGVYDRLHQILPGKPHRLFLMIGINDVSHDLSVDEIVARIRLVVERILHESPRTRLCLQSLLPINESFGRYKRLTGKTSMIPEINTRLQALAKEKGITYLDLFPHFCQPGTIILRPELTNDGLHLNEAGYDIWAAQIRKMKKKE